MVPADFYRTLVVFASFNAFAWLGVGGTASAQDQPAMPGPTKEHELLKKDVGVWDAAVSFWPQPGAEPTVSQAIETNELLPGGLWRVSHFEGDLGGMKFVGLGTFGYDPVEKKYIGTWIDSMSPYLVIAKSDYDPATETLTGMGEGRDPATGKLIISKHISRYPDEDTRTFEIHMPGEDGKLWKVMEIEYKRRGE